MNLILRARAPLRISFAGGGTDVPQYSDKYGGAVISTTIDKYAYVSISKSNKGKSTFTSHDYNITNSIDLKSNYKNDETIRLVHAVLKHLDMKNISLDITTNVDALPGSGLGSSSAVVVGLIGSLYRLISKTFTNYEIANAAYKIERIDCKIKGGLQDQYSTTFGGFNFIEFTKSSVIINPLHIREEVLNELLSSLILVDVGQRKSNSIYDKIIETQIKESEQKEGNAIENLHNIKKLAFEMRDLLLKGNIQKFGEKLGEGWEHKKNIDPNISNPHIDKLYEQALDAGAIGGKLLGAGGGGHLLLFSSVEKKNNIIKALKKSSMYVTGFNFDFGGLKTWTISKDGVMP